MAKAVPAQFYNDPSKCVNEYMATLLRTTPNLQQLGDLHVVVRRELDKSKVSLICGGGSGHEPAHAGYVGKGMLSGAVAGSVFASPPVAVILHLIRHVTGPKGCLVIVKNYTGDCLNFGLAVERARQEGLKVEMVLVGDDVTLLDTDTLAGPRGLCGVLFVQKVAGAKAEQGSSLEEVYAIAREVTARVGTASVALSPCVPPGKLPSFNLPDGSMEFGVGIHGEAGVLRSSSVECFDCVSQLFSYLADKRKLGLARTDDVAVIVNNLGGTSELEMGVIVNDVITYLTVQGYRCHRLYTGTFLTSLCMHGISISVFRINRNVELLKLLKEPAVTSAWTEGTDLTALCADSVLQIEKVDQTRIPTQIQGKAVGKRIIAEMLHRICEDLSKQVTLLDDLDRVVGDGDCGTTILHLVSHLKPKICYLNLCDNLSDLFLQLAEITELHMGGTSGDCTMLDILYPVHRILCLNTTSPLSSLAAMVIKGCETGVMKTKLMEPRAGRSSYLRPEETKTTEDPGAVACSTWITSVCKVLYAGSF